MDSTSERSSPFGERSGSLDPVQNKCHADHQPGEKRAAWLRAWGEEEWGRLGDSCGGLTVAKRVDGGTLLAPVLCHQWKCGRCGPPRAAWLKREIKAQVDSGLLTEFWTLTVRTSTCTPAESFQLVSKSWEKLRKVLQKHHGHFEFIWVREVTKRGYAHLHLLTSLQLDPAELSRLWLQSTGGSWIVDAQSVESDRAANYISKYVVEESTRRAAENALGMQKARVFSKSKGILFEPFIKPAEGEVVVVAKGWRAALHEAMSYGTVEAVKIKGSPWVKISEDLLGGLEDPRPPGGEDPWNQEA